MIIAEEIASANVVAEIHFHGKNSEGNQGVLAIQFIAGVYNRFIWSLNIKTWDFKKSFSAEPGSDSKICLKNFFDRFDLTTLLNGPKQNTHSYFQYKGSLTKPPCTEQVDWFVMKYPGTISDFQISDLKTYGLEKARVIPDNIRNVQSLNGRIINFQEAVACPELPPQKVEPPNLDYKYIHASHTHVIHGMASDKVPIKDVFDAISDKEDSSLITLSPDLNLQ